MAVTLEKNSSYELVGSLIAINDQAKHDKIFDCDVRIFLSTGEFRQKIKILSANLNLTGSYEGQVCSEVEGKCVLFSGDLAFDKINVTGSKAGSENPKPKEKDQAAPAQSIDSTKPETTSEIKQGSTKTTGPILDPSILKEKTDADNESLWGYMIVAFVLGLASLITPCVFPMIPMTVTFFLRDGQTRSKGIRMALFFGLSIIFIYTVVGTAFALLFGAEGSKCIGHALATQSLCVWYLHRICSFLSWPF